MTDAPKPTHGVVVRQVENCYGLVIGVSGTWSRISMEYLHPLPPSLTPQDAAVIEAADRADRRWYKEPRKPLHDHMSSLHTALDARRLALAPPVVDVVEELIAAGEALGEARAKHVAAFAHCSPSLKEAIETQSVCVARWNRAIAAARAKPADPR